MKYALIALLLFSFYNSMAQNREKYDDYRWKETEPKYARFYSTMERTDSGWHRRDYFVHGLTLQMYGTYEDSACKIPNGFFAYFYANKTTEMFGRYQHGKKQGWWLVNYYDGTLSDSTVYNNGNPVGTRPEITTAVYMLFTNSPLRSGRRNKLPVFRVPGEHPTLL